MDFDRKNFGRLPTTDEGAVRHGTAELLRVARNFVDKMNEVVVSVVHTMSKPVRAAERAQRFFVL